MEYKDMSLEEKRKTIVDMHDSGMTYRKISEQLGISFQAVWQIYKNAMKNNANKRYYKDLTGNRYGLLTAVRKTDKRQRSNILWECKCDCGRTAYVSSTNLIRGIIKSCDAQSCKDNNRDYKRMYKTNTSGIRGVSKYRNVAYYSTIMYHNKYYFLLYSRDINECIAVRKEAEKHVKEGDFVKWFTELKNKKIVYKSPIKYIPKKILPHITDCYQDSDGYWAVCEKGWHFENTDCHTAHGNTIAEFIQDIRSIKEVGCENDWN